MTLQELNVPVFNAYFAIRELRWKIFAMGIS